MKNLNRSIKITAPPRDLRGFTLLELMIVIVIMAIVLAIALPNYTRMAQRQDVAGNARNFESALNLARQQAYTLGQPVSVCMVADVTGNGLQNCQAWNSNAPAGAAPGWIVFRNTNGDDKVDANETKYNRFQVIGDGTTVKWNSGTVITLSPRSGTNNNAGTMTAFSPALGEANGATVVLLALGKVTYTPPK